jgi:hypothetical protein
METKESDDESYGKYENEWSEYEDDDENEGFKKGYEEADEYDDDVNDWVD